MSLAASRENGTYQVSLGEGMTLVRCSRSC